MCQARVYVRRGGVEQLVMEDVARVEVEDDTCTLSTLFGEEERIRGRIARIDLLKHTVHLEEIEEVEDV